MITQKDVSLTAHTGHISTPTLLQVCFDSNHGPLWMILVSSRKGQMLRKQVKGRSNRSINTKRMLSEHLIFLLNVVCSFPKENKNQEFLPSKLMTNWYLLVPSITAAEIKVKSKQYLERWNLCIIAKWRQDRIWSFLAVRSYLYVCVTYLWGVEQKPLEYAPNGVTILDHLPWQLHLYHALIYAQMQQRDRYWWVLIKNLKCTFLQTSKTAFFLNVIPFWSYMLSSIYCTTFPLCSSMHI